jgi:CheY-like chemotaxis protein
MNLNMNVNIRHILLAEDDPQDAKLTLAALQEYNVANRVFVVHDGEAALDYLYCRGKFEKREGGNPVAVLLDLKMPKIDGLEVLKIIKGDANLRTIPIVVLTSSRETPDLTDCYEHGVNAYVVKPVDIGEFAIAVKQLGGFWAVVNEPPPFTGKEGASIQIGEVVSTEKKENINAISAPYPALGR